MDFRIIALPVLALLGLAIYSWNLQPLNAYQGMVPVGFGFGLVVLFVAWTGLAATVLPRRLEQPSDLFLFFYVVICLLWGSTLWGATGLLSLPGATLLLLLLYLPALAIKVGARFLVPAAHDYVMPVYLFRSTHLYLPLICLLAIGSIAAVSTLGHGSFGIDNVYDRRLAGRDALSGDVFAGYAINIAINGAAPLLAFLAGCRRSAVLLGTAGAFVVLMFWLLGLKSPFINVAALFCIGFAISFPALRRIAFSAMLGGMILLFAFVAWQVADGSYSALADYGLRRIAMVQPEVQSYYVVHFQNLGLWQKLFGADLLGHSDWTYLIGDLYLHNPATNANTNGFLHALLRGGLLGYCVAVVVVGGLLVIADILYQRTRMPEFIGLAGLYGILISEQSYTTALLSSGVAICLAIIVLFSYPSSRTRMSRHIG